VSQAICSVCGVRGTVNNQLPSCGREDCPDTAFARAMKPFLVPSPLVPTEKPNELIKEDPMPTRKPKHWSLWARIVRRVKFWLCPHWSIRHNGRQRYECKWCTAQKEHFYTDGPWKLYWHPTDTWRKGSREIKRR